MWKPGQLVTIDRKVYRVTKSRMGCFTCKYLNYNHFEYPCKLCMLRIAIYCCLEPLKPKNHE